MRREMRRAILCLAGIVLVWTARRKVTYLILIRGVWILEMKNERSRGRWAFRIIILLFALGIFFTGIEVYFRYFTNTAIIIPGLARQKNALSYKASLFSRQVLEPSAMVVKGHFDTYYGINSKGYRGPEFSFEKPEGTIRIMVYGGSAVFDILMSMDDHWPYKAQGLLHERGFTKVEVINAGIPGHASFDSVGRLFSEGHYYAPDFVAMDNAWNDLKYFLYKGPPIPLVEPYHRSRDPRLDYHNAVDRFLGERLSSYLFVRQKFYIDKLNIGPEGGLGDFEKEPDVQNSALRQYKLNFMAFADIARDAGAEPVLIIQPRLVSADNREEDKEKIRYEYPGMDHRQLVEAFSMTDEIISEVAREKEAFLIDSTSRLTGKPEYFEDHVHFSKKGSDKMAEIFAGEMEKILLEKSRASSLPAP